MAQNGPSVWRFPTDDPGVVSGTRPASIPSTQSGGNGRTPVLLPTSDHIRSGVSLTGALYVHWCHNNHNCLGELFISAAREDQDQQGWRERLDFELQHIKVTPARMHQLDYMVVEAPAIPDGEAERISTSRDGEKDLILNYNTSSQTWPSDKNTTSYWLAVDISRTWHSSKTFLPHQTWPSDKNTTSYWLADISRTWHSSKTFLPHLCLRKTPCTIVPLITHMDSDAPPYHTEALMSLEGMMMQDCSPDPRANNRLFKRHFTSSSSSFCPKLNHDKDAALVMMETQLTQGKSPNHIETITSAP
uniref:Uncharacterized protein n=1 Tax=Branchiostoma floridae TaxID=7739 RepID=C3Y3S3_BRAFL|eukprot:XP_002608939.1 hypothetical protein BRAFLDRAFT_85486 [Branchiostoma floridae]